MFDIYVLHIKLVMPSELLLTVCKNEIHLSCGAPAALMSLDLVTAFNNIDHATFLNSLKIMVF